MFNKEMIVFASVWNHQHFDPTIFNPEKPGLTSRRMQLDALKDISELMCQDLSRQEEEKLLLSSKSCLTTSLHRLILNLQEELLKRIESLFEGIES
ncbi:hypothetical protein PGTUg99_027265 [Puccinia graminis f. sp. tritici]|uniref:Uncharacterized protein n=1 Tax=Puccinia graminis f. sp. tritici TaxID=56615 RepID=A0A5B0R7H8_PUCGR|nr:hypothetical protein PGTUg99_027265 [Puccinia graminis f. sp. tritici]